MNIKQNLCYSGNYRSYRRDGIKYLVWHYTAGNGDTDEGNGAYFAGRDTGDTSAHYFVDEDSITNSVPDGACAFHCGAKTYKHPECRNDNSIGIEMCSDKDASGNYIITEATVKNAVELGKYLMKLYNIDINHNLRHFDVTGKNCPAPWVQRPELWADFKARLTKPAENKESEDDEEMKRYEKLSDIPDEYGFRTVIETLMNAKIISGDGSDKAGNNDVIDLSHDQVRSMVFEYRGGAFDRKLIAEGLKPAVNI